MLRLCLEFVQAAPEEIRRGGHITLLSGQLRPQKLNPRLQRQPAFHPRQLLERGFFLLPVDQVVGAVNVRDEPHAEELPGQIQHERHIQQHADTRIEAEGRPELLNRKVEQQAGVDGVVLLAEP